MFKIENETKKNNITFSKFVIEACIYALENMDKKWLYLLNKYDKINLVER